MGVTTLLRKISFIDKEIKYYKKVYPGNVSKILELLNKRKTYNRQLKKQLV